MCSGLPAQASGKADDNLGGVDEFELDCFRSLQNKSNFELSLL